MNFTRIVGAIGYALSAANPSEAASRAITVNVTARTDAGIMLENMPIAVSGSVDGDFQLTGVDGKAAFALDAEDGKILQVHLSDGIVYSLAPEVRGLAERQCAWYSSEYHLPQSLPLLVTPGETVFECEVVASPAVTVHMVPSDGTGDGRAYAVAVLDGAWGRVNIPGFFDFNIRGVKRSAPAEIVFQWAGSSQSHIVHLTAAQTAQDTDLGIREFIDASATVEVPITMTGVSPTFDASGHPLHEAVCLIKSDGAVIIGFLVDPATGIAMNRRPVTPPAETPKVPPGEYYVAPGAFSGQVQVHLYHAIRNGRHVSLDVAGVPKVTVVEGQPASVSFEMIQARDAILAVKP